MKVFLAGFPVAPLLILMVLLLTVAGDWLGVDVPSHVGEYFFGVFVGAMAAALCIMVFLR